MIYDPLPIGRICRSCHKWKPRNELKKHCRQPDGVEGLCLACHRKRGLSYFYENHEDILEKHRVDYIARKDILDERNKAHYRKNPQKMMRRVTAWGIIHPEKVKRYKRTWRQNNPVKQQIARERRRSRQSDLPHTFTYEDWSGCLAYWNHRCAYCGNQQGLFAGMNLTQDHFIPVSKRGGYTPGNILPACQRCNTSKLDRDAAEWLTRKFGKRNAAARLRVIEDYFATVRK